MKDQTKLTKNSGKIKIGISSCLLGYNVRYDGGHKKHAIVNNIMSNDFEWIAVCPEVESGMSVPRPPIQIELHGPHSDQFANLEVVEVNNKSEIHTQKLFSYASDQVLKLSMISGFIGKSRSPSCGIKIPYFYKGSPLLEGSGFFIKKLKETYPLLPIIDEIGLEDPTLRQKFIDDVILYDLKKSNR